MEQSVISTSEVKAMRGSTTDVISNLPCNVLEKILMHLSLHAAARTSVLSKKWRHIWTTLPQLVFDGRFSKECGSVTRDKLMMTIYHVLLQHRGPLLRFKLSLKALGNCPEIDQFIRFVSNNGVQELSLHTPKSGPYKLPSSLFSCQVLTHLSLISCVVKPPPGFKGFSRLLSLKLLQVVIAGDTLSCLISTCPLLEHLKILSRSSFDLFEIDARNLRCLEIEGPFSSVCFKNCPRLEKVSMHLLSSSSKLVSKEQEPSSSVILGATFPAVELLELDYYYLKAMANGGLPNSHPFTLDHLKILKLHVICFEEVDEMSMILCLIRSSPKLEKIQLEISETVPLDPVQEPLEVQGWSDISLSQLRQVELHRVCGTRPELDFIKAILAKSPILVRLLINLESEEVSEELRILKELIQFKRLSPEAVVMFGNRDEVLSFCDFSEARR